MRRRNFLYGASLAGFSAIAGCLSWSEDDSGDNNSPTETIEAYVAATSEGDVETVHALLHDDGKADWESEHRIVQGEFTLEEIHEIETSDTEAIIEVIRKDATASPLERFMPMRFVLRLSDGRWQIWDITMPNEIVPNAVFDSSQTDDGLKIEHVDGEALSADKVYIREGYGLESTGLWKNLSGSTSADGRVTKGDSITIKHEDNYTAYVVWTDGEIVLPYYRENQGGPQVEPDPLQVDCGGGWETTEAPQSVNDYLAEANSYNGLVDWTGNSEVTVEVGACEDGLSFSPAAIRIDPDTTVTWEWTGHGLHNVTAESGDFASDLLEDEGATFERIFSETGTWLYSCSPHEALGMKGAIVVRE